MTSLAIKTGPVNWNQCGLSPAFSRALGGPWMFFAVATCWVLAKAAADRKNANPPDKKTIAMVGMICSAIDAVEAVAAIANRNVIATKTYPPVTTSAQGKSSHAGKSLLWFQNVCQTADTIRRKRDRDANTIATNEMDVIVAEKGSVPPNTKVVSGVVDAFFAVARGSENVAQERLSLSVTYACER